ncbi:MAG: AAA family ATPase [Bradyrhizobiaceae bacterium]|nr:AAA family ATPase [Bradyrhizobiaceae bacterium]
MPHDDHHIGAQFLAATFGERTEHPFYISCLKNDGSGEAYRLRTRDPNKIAKFIERHDGAGVGIYFCVSTIKPNATTRSKDTISEIALLHADIDFKDVVEEEPAIWNAIDRLTCPPSRAVLSGHGVHCYWSLAEPLPATQENIVKIEQLLRMLRHLLAADDKVCHPAALMRLVGTHNSKRNEWTPVEVVSAPGNTYSFDELLQWLRDCGPPVLTRRAASPDKGDGAGNGYDPSNSFLDFAGSAVGAHIDVEARLAAMRHRGPDDSAVHVTQRDCSASLLSRGTPIEEVVQTVLNATRKAASAAGVIWDWERERKKIENMCGTWIAKHPEITPSSEPPPLPPLQLPPDYKPLKLLRINIAHWDDEPPPDQEWGCFNRFPMRQCNLLGGEGAVGKSTTLLHLTAAHTIPHMDWLGAILSNGPALLIDCEDEEQVLWRRTAPICEHYHVRFADLRAGGLHLVSLVGHDPVMAVATRSGKIEMTKRYHELVEMAGDLKPKCIAIASSANIYAGSEIDRSQVQQFTQYLTRVARIAGGYLVLAQHPSLTGIDRDTGLSGSTQWHNAVRARAYMRGVKTEPGEQPDSDLREIVFKKNQYGKTDETIVLRWQHGMFLPEPGVRSLDKAAAEQKHDEVFLNLLRRFNDQNQDVGASPSRIYAPSVFANHDEAKGLTSKQLTKAMQRLLDAKVIEVKEDDGPPSRRRKRLVVR